MIILVVRGREEQLGFIEKDQAKIWKEHVEKIINEENEWDQMVETDIIEGQVEKVTHNEIVETMLQMKSGKAAEPSDVSVEIIAQVAKFGLK